MNAIATPYRTMLACVLTLATVAGSAARADILYADNFSGTALTALAGTTPDTRSGDFGSSASATWDAGAQFEADGRVWSSPNSRASALLPFTPVSGQLYELKADIDGISTFAGQEDDWVALGFSRLGTASGQNFANNNEGYAWMTVSSLGGANQGARYAGGALANAATFETTTAVMALKILLDTRDANWTVEWFLDGTKVTDTHTYTTNPDINFVGFSRFDHARARIDNFQLSVIPEPSSLSLLLAAGVAVFLMERRRRRA